MTRRAATTAIILALLTGIVLGQLGSLAVHPGDARPAASKSSPRALVTARSFYESIDRLLVSGDRSIESIVTPEFVDHQSNGDDERTLPEMIDWLLALRATWPHLRIQVVDLQQHDRLIAVRLNIDPGDPSSLPGVPLTTSLPHQVREFLRVEVAVVAERWAAAAQLPVVTRGMNFEDHWSDAALVAPGIEQIVLDPGRSVHLWPREQIIIWTESGSVQFDRAGVDLEGNRRSLQDPLDAGQIRIQEGGTPLSVRNVSIEPAEIWLLSNDISRTEQHASSESTTELAQPSIVAFIPLHVSTGVRGSPRRLSIAHLTLPPGSMVIPHTPGIVEEIAVLSGVIEVNVDRGRALVCTDGNTAQPFDDTVTISTGQGVSANESASLGYRAAGPQPATILVMHIEGGASPPATIP